MHEDETIATLHASAVRRFLAYAAVFALGAMLLLLAFTQPPGLGWQLFLIVLGAGALAAAERMRRATQSGLILTEHELRDTGGQVLTRIDNIKSVDRGTFAFKPSNGFVLHLHRSQRGSWAPGLWWRYATRLGVGGVTPSGPAKYMAEQIALQIASQKR